MEMSFVEQDDVFNAMEPIFLSCLLNLEKEKLFLKLHLKKLLIKPQC